MPPALNLVVEAESAEMANIKAERAGAYFDPIFVRDCECCGERWREASDRWAEKYETLMEALTQVAHDDDAPWVSLDSIPRILVI